MKKSTLNVLCILFMVFLSTNLRAQSRVHCGELRVRVQATPDKHCVLTHASILHGRLAGGSIIPALITHIPGDFVMLQTIFGPDLELTYKCNNAEPISIRMSQGLCLMRGGNISVSSSAPGVYASWTEASYLFDTPGSVTWVL